MVEEIPFLCRRDRDKIPYKGSRVPYFIGDLTWD